VNQWLTENHYRKFPFRLDATPPFNDDILVDMLCVLSSEFQLFLDNGGIELNEVESDGSTVELTFAIVSSAKTGYKLVGSFSTSDEEDTRIILSLQDSSSVPHPELGYGIAFIGNPASLDSWVASLTGLSDQLDPSVVRVSDTGHVTTLRVANKVHAGPSSCDETEGAASSFMLQNRTAAVVAGCVEVTTEPVETQEKVTPTVQGTSTVDVAVEPPETEYTHYVNSSVVTITTHAVTIDDEIPSLPTTHDAEVDGSGALASAPLLEAGHNTVLNGDLSQNLIRLGYRLGAGLGVDCAEVKGFPDLGTLAKDCVKSINGAHTQDGNFTLVAGDGVTLVPDPAGHRILVLINAQDLKRAQP
jgi:hypothetical protein